MLRGVYNRSGGPARDLEAIHRLQEPAAGAELLVRGPLAVAWTPDPSVGCAELDGISCVIDGYLYDPADLARELGVGGANVPELVARAYQRHGEEALRELRGRFALVLWDSVRRRGLLACDLLATQPLFSLHGAGWLAFAGELRELLPIAPSRPGPDPLAAVTWIGGGSCPEGRTLYEGVSRMQPGHLIELGAGTDEPRRYWRPRFEGIVRASRSEHAARLREQLERSVERRLSPRSSGVVLSGGLDSSIVTAVASRVRPPDAQVGTYSAVFPGHSEFDETWKIRSVTEALGIEPAAYELDPQGALWLGLQYSKQWELPLVGAATLVDTAMVAEAARNGSEVVLDGQLGDEVLGFSPYLVSDRLMRGRLLSALELTGRWPIGRPTTPREQLRILKQLGLKGAAPHRLGRVVRSLREQDARGRPWLGPAARRQYAELDDKWAWKTGTSGPRWWRYLADMLVNAAHRHLRLDYLRHRAAAVGVLSETPLYDFDLIDHVLRLPPDLAFHSAHTRPLAREAVRGLIPDEVRLNNKKAVFSSFCFEMLTGADAPGIERLLTARDAEIGAYADMEWVRRMWHEDRPRSGGTGTGMWGTVMWRLVAAECWLRAQRDSGFVDDMLAHGDVLPPSVRRVSLAETGTFSHLAADQSRT